MCYAQHIPRTHSDRKQYLLGYLVLRFSVIFLKPCITVVDIVDLSDKAAASDSGRRERANNEHRYPTAAQPSAEHYIRHQFDVRLIRRQRVEPVA